MISLTREVRFSIISNADQRPVWNSWGGWPSASEVAPWSIFRCTLNGELDPVSGYLCNIKLIDDALRKKVVNYLSSLEFKSYESLLMHSFQQIKDLFPANCQIQQLQIVVTPTLEYTLPNCDKVQPMSTEPTNAEPTIQPTIQMTQQFEFSASHRLHNPELTEDQNRDLYGKCNNPHGHGHNYVVMVTVEGQPEGGRLVSLEEFEQLVKQQVIDRMDHRNLNVELAEFRETNPSVENIAIVIWNLLAKEVGQLKGKRAQLNRVRVYETPKTWADYSGPS